MNKIFLGMMAVLLGMGPAAYVSAAPVTQAKANTVVFQSDDNVDFTVVLPNAWTTFADPQELDDADNVAFENKRQNLYAGIAIYNAEDYEGFNEFVALSEEAFDVPFDRQEKVSYNGFSGNRYYFEDVIDGLKLGYVSDVVSNGDYYVVSQAWIRKSQLSKNHDDIVSVFKSLRLKR